MSDTKKKPFRYRDDVKEAQKAWCIRKACNWKRLGIKGASYKRYKAIFTAQGGVCAICGQPPTTQMHALDHDHATGEIRGILCKRCNWSLGYLDKDNRLLKAFNYLRKHAARMKERSVVNSPAIK